MNQVSLVRFRQANVDDIPAMSAIRLQVRENVLSDPSRISEQMYRDYLALLGRGWVAEVAGEIAGFCYAARTDSSIWALFVSRNYEGQGIARHLLRLAVTWLFEQGHKTVRLSTGKGTRADRFYAAQGWMRERSDDVDTYYLLTRPEGSDMEACSN
jgi:GNAT superfamily N-acetyltransferase